MMSRSTQLIDGDGNFNAAELDTFIREVKLTECGLSYAVVSIIGRQSTGKSTLLNHLFQTDFREINAKEGRTQPTTGIWIGECVGIQPCTIALDVEGSESTERGEGHIFEKQSCLFALAISDVVLINMWSNEIGLAGAASKYLLTPIFEVMLRLFSSRKTKLMLLFVLRDAETPFEMLDKQLKKVIEKIWDETTKPLSRKWTKLYDVFRVEVVALPHFAYQLTEFEEEVAKLRQRFSGSISPGGLAGDRQGVVPASGFSLSLQTIWKQIKENKGLNLPALKVMVANARCEEIADQKLKQLMEYAGPLLDLQAARETGPEKGFGERLSSILDEYLRQYDIEAVDFDKSVRSSKRRLLTSRALDALFPACNSMVENLCSELFKEFKVAFKEELKKGQPFDMSVKVCTNSCLADFRAQRGDASLKQADWAFESCAEKLDKEILEHKITNHLAYLAEQNAAQQRVADAQAAYIAELQATEQRKAEAQAAYIAALQTTQKNAEAQAVHIADLKAEQQKQSDEHAAIIAELKANQQKITEEHSAKIAEVHAKFELEARERHRIKWEGIFKSIVSKSFSLLGIETD